MYGSIGKMIIKFFYFNIVLFVVLKVFIPLQNIFEIMNLVLKTSNCSSQKLHHS